MQSAREAVSDIAASAKAGMEKTKAVMQEKVERMAAENAQEKESATERKEERIREAESHKQEAFSGGTHSYSTTGATGQPTGGNQMSALPGQPTGQVIEGTAEAHPMGTATATGARPTTAHNTHVGGGANQGYSTGGAYS